MLLRSLRTNKYAGLYLYNPIWGSRGGSGRQRRSDTGQVYTVERGK